MAPIRDISTQHPGIWEFVLTTNLNSSIRLGSRELDTMLVGGFVGVEGAGLYKIAKQIAAIPAMLSDPLYQVIYPDLSRLWARGEIKTFKQLLLRSGLVAGGGATVIWLGVVLLGSFFIQIVFGAEFVPAQPVLVWYMLAMVIAIYGFPFNRLCYRWANQKQHSAVPFKHNRVFPIVSHLHRMDGLVGAVLRMYAIISYGQA